MPRRSTRLDSQGYYDNEGRPIICYKEHLNRVFNSRCSRSSSFRSRAESTSTRNIHNNIITNMDKNIKSYKDSESNTNRPSNSNEIGDSYRNDVNNTSSNRHRNSRFSTIFNQNVFYILFCIIVLCFGFACREEFLLNKLNKETMTNFESQVNTLREEILRLNKVLNSLQPVADTMPNFALESQEARVLLDRSSQTYSKKGGCAYLFGIFCKRPVHPRTVLQGGSPRAVGRCWPFEGGQGHLFIALSHPAYISHVTLGHISKNLSPTGTIPSAPKTFSVYGMTTLDDKETYLGTSLFDQDGDATQTFELPDHGTGVFKYVKLQVESNWGHPDYTCLYNFRVHGKLAEVTDR
ncbi:SUN domain-containing protein 3 isoform X1 [Pseudochaenichthys georgianus]|uniref:SUN domain-containing protein 3 isoform X1 n=2 Tax=Pseudochaenichthys georgianus TaxID=52239 RepID=UPI00146D740F|nr:SUN domain-containing protein 3-like isoform X1 [Pseudochaenichthys georgianus]